MPRGLSCACPPHALPAGSAASGRTTDQGRNAGVTADSKDDLLQGTKVFVVEDEAAISMLLE
ncbi:hypothetical protein, partial [Klebsiella aerogenes]|uniref:hypothetical protein n=1 Tax=Klebsiella aerogenes TaxID=548 RepID=UPI001952F71B